MGRPLQLPPDHEVNTEPQPVPKPPPKDDSSSSQSPEDSPRSHPPPDLPPHHDQFAAHHYPPPDSGFPPPEFPPPQSFPPPPAPPPTFPVHQPASGYPPAQAVSDFPPSQPPAGYPPQHPPPPPQQLPADFHQQQLPPGYTQPPHSAVPPSYQPAEYPPNSPASYPPPQELPHNAAPVPFPPPQQPQQFIAVPQGQTNQALLGQPTTPLHILQRPQPIQQEWKTSLFDCADDPTTAFITCCFPCITFGQIAEIIDRGQTTCGFGGSVYGVLMICGLGCLYSYNYRTKLRTMFDLMEVPGPDLLVHCLCECCALCQIYGELKKRGIDPSIGWQNPSAHTPQMIPPTVQQMMA